MKHSPSPQKRKYSILILVALLVLSLIGNIYFFTQDSFSEPVENPYPFIDISRNYIPQEHFIVNLEPLRIDLRDYIQKEGTHSISLYFEFLNTGGNIAINPDLAIWPASLAKLPLAMAVTKKAERGIWNLDDQLVLLEIDRDRQWGTLYKNPLGTTFTIETLLKELLINSDNTAYKILLRNTDPSELEDIVEEMGLEELFAPDGKVSAKEYSRLLRSLYTSSFLQREYSQKILLWLTESSSRDFLARGLPSTVPFAHKIGENVTVNVYADSGIVYLPNRPYLITVMIQGAGSTEEDKKRAQEIMKTVSEKIYAYVQSN